MNRSSYYIAEIRDNIVFLVDLNRGKSVTNDAENVVADTVSQYGNKRIVCRDRHGIWVALLHNNGKFTGFLDFWDFFNGAPPK